MSDFATEFRKGGGTAGGLLGGGRAAGAGGAGDLRGGLLTGLTGRKPKRGR